MHPSFLHNAFSPIIHCNNKKGLDGVNMRVGRNVDAGFDLSGTFIGDLLIVRGQGAQSQ